MTQEITLEQFHELLENAYAVEVNDYLYYVGYNTNGTPYTATKDGEDYTDLSSVDGEIMMDDVGVYFYLAEELIRMKFLLLQHDQALTDYFAAQVAI